jgi:hypothetical protein
MSKDLLKGVIDIHVHSGPDNRPRKFTDLELAENMKKAGARALIMKSHVLPTMDRAFIGRQVTGFDVYGAIVLNRAVGGFNPWAVENALKMGAKTVWMPTMDAANHLKWYGKPGGLLAVETGNRLAPGLNEILQLIADYNAILSTGHIGVEEQKIVIEKAKEKGVKKIVIDHPELGVTKMSPSVQKEFVDKFGVYLERCATIEDFKRAYDIHLTTIKEIGCESTIIVTDAGVPELPFWDDLMSEYLTAFVKAGITREQLDIMTKKNPARLLGLE